MSSDSRDRLVLRILPMWVFADSFLSICRNAKLITSADSLEKKMYLKYIHIKQREAVKVFFEQSGSC